MDSESVFNQPSHQQINDFIKGDPVAVDEVVNILLPQISRWAIKKYSMLPVDEVQSEVHLVFAETCRNHKKYDPEKSQLTTYIINLLKLRMRTLYQKHKQQEPVESIDDYEKMPNPMYNESQSKAQLSNLDRERYFVEVEFQLNGQEREFFALMQQGEKKVEIFIHILKKYGLSNSESDVKNAKEKLLRKLKKIADEKGFSFEDLSE